MKDTLRYIGPDFSVKLSAHDTRHDGFYSRRLLIFQTKPSLQRKEILDILDKALQLLVKKIPILGGRVEILDDKESEAQSPTGQKRWRSVSKGDGITLVVKDGTKTVPSFDSLQTTNFQPELLPEEELLPLRTAFMPDPYEMAYFQLNWIDGGVILACCIAHLAADGTANTEILKILAGYCRSVYESSKSEQELPENKTGPEPSTNSQQEKWRCIPTDPPIGLDRTCLLGLSPSKDAQNIPPDDGAMVTIKPGQFAAGAKQELPPHVFKVYRVTHESLLRLKHDAAPGGDSEVKWISTNDALVALAWRAVVSNRVAAGVLPADDCALAFGFPVSAATRFPGVEKEFIGNTLLNRRIDHLTLADVLHQPNALAKIAAVVRAKVNAVTPDVIAWYTQQAESSAAADDLKTSVILMARVHGIVLASLYNSASLYESDWGEPLGGPVVRLRSSNKGFAADRTLPHFILPKLSDGSAEMLLGVYENGIDAMEKDPVFAQYVEKIPKVM